MGSLPQTGVQLVAQGLSAFLGALQQGSAAVLGFGQQAQGAGQQAKSGSEIITGALREIGTVAIDSLMRAGQAVIGFGKQSIDVASQFEGDFAQFENAVGHTIDNTGLKFDDFKNLFIKLGKELPVSTSEVEQAAIEMAKGGIDPATIAAGGLRTTIQFAAAAMKGDLVGAAQISSKTMQAWTNITDDAKTKTDFLTHAQNLLGQATTAASTNVNELFLGLSNVGGTARLAGVSFDETVTALAQLTPSFASASDAGTSFKTFLDRLQPSSKPAIEALTGLGLYSEKTGSAFYDAQGKFVGMAKAEDLLKKATDGLTDAQKASILHTIFGQDAIRAAGVFVRQGADGYNALAKSISQQTTVTDAAANVQATYGTSVENVKGSIEALQITLGTQLLPTLTELMNTVVAPAINTLTNFASALFGDKDALSELSPAIAAYIPIVQQVGAEIYQFATVTLVDTFGSAITFIQDHWAEFQGALLAIGGLLAVVTTVTAITSAIALLTNPITLVVGAVALLGAAWNANWGGIQDKTEAVWTYIQPTVTQLYNWLAAKLPVAVAAASQAWTTVLWPALQAVGGFIISYVVPALTTVVSWLATKVPPAVKGAADFWSNVLWPALQTVATFITGTVVPTVEKLANGTLDILNRATNGASIIWTGTLKPAFETVANVLNTYIFPLFAALADVYLANVEKLTRNLANAWTTYLKPALDAVASFIDKNVNPVLKYMADVAIGNLLKMVKDFWEGLNTNLVPTLKILGGLIVESLVPAWQGFDGVVKGFNQTLSTLGDWITKAIGWLKDLAAAIRGTPKMPSGGSGAAADTGGGGGGGGSGTGGGGGGGSGYLVAPGGGGYSPPSTSHYSNVAQSTSIVHTQNYNMPVYTNQSPAALQQGYHTLRALAGV